MQESQENVFALTKGKNSSILEMWRFWKKLNEVLNNLFSGPLVKYMRWKSEVYL